MQRLNAQAKGFSNQTLKFLRGSFPNTLGVPGQPGSTVSLKGGEAEIRLIDTTLDSGWLNYPGASVHLGQTRLHVKGLGADEDTAVSLDTDFTMTLQPDGGSPPSVLGGRLVGSFNTSGAFRANGDLSTVTLPALAEHVIVQHVTADVEFVSTGEAVLFDHFALSASLMLTKFDNSVIAAAGLVSGDRYGFVTQGNIPAVRGVGAALCRTHASLCSTGLNNVDLNNVDIRLAVASAEVDILGVGLQPAPRLDAGVGYRASASISSIPSDVRRVLDMLNFGDLTAVVTATIPFSPAPVCETELTFAIQSTKLVAANSSSAALTTLAYPPPRGVSLSAVRLSIHPATCDQRGPEVAVRADLTVNVAGLSRTNQPLHFAIKASVLPTGVSMVLRGELLQPWLGVAGVAGLNIHYATVEVGYSALTGFNRFLLDTAIELTPTLQANATVLFSPNSGTLGHYLLDARTSRITLLELLQFVERVAGVQLPGVSPQQVAMISGSAYAQVQIYATPTAVTIRRQGVDVQYAAGFRMQMSGRLFGMTISVAALITESTVKPCSVCSTVRFPDLQLSFSLANLNLGAMLLNPLGLSDLLIGKLRSKLTSLSVVTLGPRGCCGFASAVVHQVSRTVDAAGNCLTDAAGNTLDAAGNVINTIGNAANAAGNVITGIGNALGRRLSSNDTADAATPYYDGSRRRAQTAVFPNFKKEGCCAETSFDIAAINGTLNSIQAGIDSLLVVKQFSITVSICFLAGYPELLSLRC
eukprot:COSAG01_NODE_1638_length_9653_cov_230.802282_2_plen_756_part_00